LPPGITVKIDTSVLDRLEKEIPGKADRIVGSIAFEFEAYVKAHFSSPSPSPSDAFPAVDTGNLKNSIHAEKVRDRVWRVIDGTNYGIYLEYGTRNMAPRPFFTPTAEEISTLIAERFKALF
jgi:HK97 gp10 family phage protein